MKKLFLILLLFPSLAFAQSNQPYPKAVATVNKSAVITTGNTFQVVLPIILLANRRSLTIQNNNTSDTCWITFGTGVTAANAAKASSIALSAGQAYTRYYPYVPSDEIEGTCASNSDTLYIDVQ